MFTGIIETGGKVASAISSNKTMRLGVKGGSFWDDVALGDSVAIDGVCLTVIEIKNGTGYFDVSKETLERSIMSAYKPERIVNLEKALRLSDRLGGHIVQGHVDGIGKYVGKSEHGGNIEMDFEIPKALAKYVVGKGSICINGISLTASKINGNKIRIALIPHTLKITSLAEIKIGDSVNIEADVIAKYIEKLLLSDEGEVVNKDFLSKNRFI